MTTVALQLLDGRRMEVLRGTTALSVALSLGNTVEEAYIGAVLNGRVVDLSTPIEADATLVFITPNEQEGLRILRHSTAHLLAQAIKRMYGDQSVHLGVGPVIENGFYYDIDVPEPLSTDDFNMIERTMLQIVSENLSVKREEMSRPEARRLFAEMGDEFKLELIDELPEDAVISIYRQGEFVDLCRGPHVPSTGWLKTFKLTSVGSAFWRGDATQKSMQRIYGTAFASSAELADYIRRLEEAKQRDHRKLARDLDLFMFSEDAPGMPFYLHNGLVLRNEIEGYERSLQSRQYEEVRTPLMMNERLWKQTGHAEKYGENMYSVSIDDEAFALKPMSCPGHMLIYKNRIRSYRELPIRVAEYGICHRHELSGALSGLTRVRAFTQDDAHIFVRPDQIHAEISAVILLLTEIYNVFGFPYKVELSTRPANSIGADAWWEQAEGALREVLISHGLDYQVNDGDGAFYGPKIDFHIEDALQRSWQCGTIQLDFQLPERMDLTYIAQDGQKHRPIVIHRAIYGSMERFIGILIEHYGGAFPLWLAPVQALLIPIAPAHQDMALKLKESFLNAGIRVEVDDRNEKISYRVREAQTKKIPYTMVIGDKERASHMVSVRKYGEKQTNEVDCDAILLQLREEIQNKGHL